MGVWVYGMQIPAKLVGISTQTDRMPLRWGSKQGGKMLIFFFLPPHPIHPQLKSYEEGSSLHFATFFAAEDAWA